MAQIVLPFGFAIDRNAPNPPMARPDFDPVTKKLTVFYSGRVQGVGFRYTVKSLAPGYEATGWIKNLADGRVQLVIQGEKNELEAFREAVKQSGLGSMIRREEVDWSDDLEKFRGFEIVG